MNGIHDMGGMHGMGPVQAEIDEPVFHEAWEARVYVLTRAIGAWRKWNIDTGRYYIEQIAPADYLRMSYYEKWFTRLVELLVKTGMVSRDEIETGIPAPGSPKLSPPLHADRVPAMALNRNIEPSHEPSVRPRFKTGSARAGAQSAIRQATRVCRVMRAAKQARSIATTVSTISRTPMLTGCGPKRQHVYSVRFAARELWGEQASPRDFVYIDLWDDYLERA